MPVWRATARGRAPPPDRSASKQVPERPRAAQSGAIGISTVSAGLTHSEPQSRQMTQTDQQVLDSSEARQFGITHACVRLEAAKLSRIKASQGGVKL